MLPATKEKPAGDQKAAQRTILPNSFVKASTRTVEPFYDTTTALGAAAITLQPIDVPATGWLRHIVLDVDGSGFAGMAYLADGPWSAIQQIMFTDTNGQPVVLLSGFDLRLACMMGGYAAFGDPAAYPGYAAGAAAFSFQLRIPLEIVQRNALGALPNANAAMSYKVHITLAPMASIFVAPPAACNVRVQAHVESRPQPPPASELDGSPNMTTPPASGTTQNWSSYTAPVVVGANTIRLPRVGNTIRNLIFVNRDAAGARTDAGLPTQIGLFLDGSQVVRQSMAYGRMRLYELYGYGVADRPAGVDLLTSYTDDFDGTPGEELGEYWLLTSGATRLEVQGIWTAPGSLTVITNDILAHAESGGAGQTLGN
jgi:hypothetical protein